MSHKAAGVSTGCFSSLQSEAKFLICVYDRFCLFGLFTMFESAVFGFLPKGASKGATFVTLFGISLMLCITLATIVDISSDDHSGCIVLTPSFRVIV